MACSVSRRGFTALPSIIHSPGNGRGSWARLSPWVGALKDTGREMALEQGPQPLPPPLTSGYEQMFLKNTSRDSQGLVKVNPTHGAGSQCKQSARL